MALANAPKALKRAVRSTPRHPAPVAAEAVPGPAQAVRPDGLEEVENILPGTTLSLGDGRSIFHGERALVTPELGALLRERGQAA
jgi:hypothetical protein